MKVAILLPYGIFSPSNFQYKDYVDRAIGRLLGDSFDYLFLAGGHTNKDFPNLSEAQSIFSYLTRKLPDLKDKIIKEEKSLTTAENLQLILEILKSKAIQPDKITITCDSIRLIKVFILANQLFNQNLSEEELLNLAFDQGAERKIKTTSDREMEYGIVKVFGLNINRTTDETGDQILATLLESNFIKYPKLHQKVITWKKKVWGIE